VAAIPNSGGARYAPGGMVRALMRLVVFGSLVAAGWLLGSGISHADEDPGQPGTGLIHVLNMASVNGGSGDQFGGLPSVEPVVKRMPVVKRVLPSAPVPRPSVQPPVKVSLLRPVVDAVSTPNPLAKGLIPVARPLSELAPHHAAAPSPAHADQPATLRPTAPAVAAPTVVAPGVAAEARTPVVPVLTPLRHTLPAVLCSPDQHPADSAPALLTIKDSPGAPIPASPPGSTTSPCTIGGTGSGASTKNAPDATVRDGWMTENLTQPRGLLSRDTNDLPRSLSPQPSTSPD
jgi:hypothetical protein